MQRRPPRSRCNTDRPRAWSIARFPIPTPSRAREPRSMPIRRTSRRSSISALPSPVRGSFAKPSRRSRGGSRSNRTTRCSSDGAGIVICRCVSSIARLPISRAAARSTRRSTASGITSVSFSFCAETLPMRPHRSPKRNRSHRKPASCRVPWTGCGCRSAGPGAARRQSRCSIGRSIGGRTSSR